MTSDQAMQYAQLVLLAVIAVHVVGSFADLAITALSAAAGLALAGVTSFLISKWRQGHNDGP